MAKGIILKRNVLRPKPARLAKAKMAGAEEAPSGEELGEAEMGTKEVLEQLRLIHKRKKDVSEAASKKLTSEAAKIYDELNSFIAELAELRVRKKRAKIEGKKFDFDAQDTGVQEKLNALYSRAKTLASGELPLEPPSGPTTAVSLRGEEPKIAPARRGDTSEKSLDILEAKAAGKKHDCACDELCFQVVETIVDSLCHALEPEKNHELEVDDLAKKTGLDPSRVEAIGKTLQEAGVLELIYPVNLFYKPKLRLVRVLSIPQADAEEGTRVFECSLVATGVPASVHILDAKGEERPIYSVRTPRLGPYTEEFLSRLRDELAREVPIGTEEIADVKKAVLLKERFRAASVAILKKRLPELGDKDNSLIAGLLLQRMYGLGAIELLMADDHLEEIGINGASQPLSVYHRKFGWLKTSLRITSEEEIYNYASQIGRKSGRDITLLHPVMDAWLPSGDRVVATLFPVSSEGNTITIRRFARNPWTAVNFIDPQVNTMSVDMAAFMWLCMQYELNVLVAGGTASGKTSTLNTLCAMIPSAHRIVTIEDTRELQLPKYLHWNWLSLATRGPNPEGKGEVAMLDLMVNSLRMRPDRIVLGEIRKREEAEVLFEAMHTGHSVYSTIHADTAQQVIRRLVEPPIDVPETQLESLHVALVQYRDRRRGIRRTYEIAEVSPAGGQSKELSMNVIYRWRPRTDSFEKMNEASRTFAELGLHTGMTAGEIHQDLAEKQDVLTWMYANNLNDTDLVGEVMRAYYKKPSAIVAAARENADPKTVL